MLVLDMFAVTFMFLFVYHLNRLWRAFFQKSPALFEPDKFEISTCIETDRLFRDQQLGEAAYKFKLDLDTGNVY